MRKVKKITLATLALLAVGTAGASVAMLNVSADTATQPSNVFAMEKGAGVRLETNSTGIRFIAETTEREEGATYNFVIAPTYYFEEVLGDKDAKTADWVALFNNHAQIGENGYIHLTEIKPENFDTDANLEVCGSVHKMRFENMNLAYTGIAYKKVGEQRTYATFDSLSDISRSVTNVSSRALNSGLYDTDETNKTIMNDFIKKGFVLQAGYVEAEDGYKKGEGEVVTLEDAYTEVNPQLVINTPNQQKLLHSYAVSVATSVDIGLDIALTVDEADKANVTFANGSVQTLNEKGATFTAKAGLLTATKEISVDEVTSKNGESETIIATEESNAVIQGESLQGYAHVYDVTEGTPVKVDFTGTITAGERKYALLTADDTYYLDVIASDAVIRTLADFHFYQENTSGVLNEVDIGTHTITKNATTAKYAVLVADIDGLNKGFQVNHHLTLVPLAGATFNGLGHKMWGMRFLNGWCGEQGVKDYTVKNVVIETGRFYQDSIFGKAVSDSLFENVTVHATPENDTFFTTYDEGLLLTGGWGGNSNIFRNCTITLYVPDEFKDNDLNWSVGNYWKNTLDNVTVITNGTVNPTIPQIGEGKVTVFDKTDLNVKNTNTEYISVEYNKLTLTDLDPNFEGTPTSVLAVVPMDTRFLFEEKEFTYADGVITFADNVAGERDIVVTTDKGIYGAYAAFADAVIDNEAEFFAFMDKRTGSPAGLHSHTATYTVMTASFDCGRALNGAGFKDGSTFNGLGHKVGGDGLQLNHGWAGVHYHYNNEADAYEQKNHTVKNFDLNLKTYRGGILGFKLSNFTMENCNWNYMGEINEGEFYYWSNYALFATSTVKGTFTNCTFNFNLKRTTATMCFAAKHENKDNNIVFNNVTVTTTSKMLGYSNTVKQYDNIGTLAGAWQKDYWQPKVASTILCEINDASTWKLVSADGTVVDKLSA